MTDTDDLEIQASLVQSLLPSVLQAETLAMAEAGTVVRVTLTSKAHAYVIPMVLRGLRAQIKDVSFPADPSGPMIVTFANESQIEFVKGAGL